MSATNAIAYTLGTLGLITVLALGATVLLGRHSGSRPGRLHKCNGSSPGWRWFLRRERRRARERELRLLSYAQAQINTT
ncbi:hypothetical protein, partial [Streptomyces sp. NPDC002619]|uniref:hypothetical protein n=1 Tax=Streptomyces sp. NPDC002619 TaxID=3364655 RepID=UPI0036A68923